MEDYGSKSIHAPRNALIMTGLCAVTIWSHQIDPQYCGSACSYKDAGCNVYCVGHESAHRKLYPQNPLKQRVGSNFYGYLFHQYFSKIHDFHHAANRRDEQTSALDIYSIPQCQRLQRLLKHLMVRRHLVAVGSSTV